MAIQHPPGNHGETGGTPPRSRPGLTVDMGRARRIGGFTYLPRQDWVFEGVVDRYRFEISLDGMHWTTRYHFTDEDTEGL